jgi:hypothetical protein
MRKLISILLVLFAVSLANGQTLKPYILGSTFTGSMDDAKTQTTAGLQGAGFTVVGQYMPVADASRWVIIISHPALDKAVKTVGGLTGFASTLRLGLTKEDDGINISYTNPVYWGNAYFRDDFDKVSREYSKVEADFKQAVSAVGTAKGSSFGSEEGVELDEESTTICLVCLILMKLRSSVISIIMKK